MNQDEIIEMARQAGFGLRYEGRGQISSAPTTTEKLEAFAKLVAAKEREAWPAEMEAMERQVEILSDELSKAKSATRKETLEEMIYAHPTTAIEKAVEEEREACAKYVEGLMVENQPLTVVMGAIGDGIRARGEA